MPTVAAAPAGSLDALERLAAVAAARPPARSGAARRARPSAPAAPPRRIRRRRPPASSASGRARRGSGPASCRRGRARDSSPPARPGSCRRPRRRWAGRCAGRTPRAAPARPPAPGGGRQRAGAERPRMRLRRDRQPRHLLVGGQRQVAAALGMRRRGGWRRPQPQDQLELHQRRLQLASQRPRLDPLGRLQRMLDRPPKPPAGEVRAHPRAQVGCLADVQHAVVAIAEQVDAGAGGTSRASSRSAAPAGGPGRRRRRRGHRADAVLLSHAEQDRPADLGRGLGVGQRAVAGPHAGVEALRQRGPGSSGRTRPSSSRPGERDGVDHGRGQPPALPAGDSSGVDEADVEARVVRDQHRSARELRTPAAPGRSAAPPAGASSGCR